MLPRYGGWLRVVASAHGVCLAAAAVYAGCIERYTHAVPREVIAHYLLPVHLLFGIGVLSVGIALAMHDGRKRLHWAQWPNLACALVLYGFCCLSITHDGL